MNEEMNNSADDPNDERILCPNCGEVNRPLPHFCSKCGAPLSSFANVGPWETIQSEGFAYRQAVGGPPKKIILIGIWMIFAPMLLVMIFFVLPMFIMDHPHDQSDIMPLGVMFLIGLFAAILLFRTTRNYILKKRMVEPPPAGDTETSPPEK